MKTSDRTDLNRKRLLGVIGFLLWTAMFVTLLFIFYNPELFPTKNFNISCPSRFQFFKGLCFYSTRSASSELGSDKVYLIKFSEICDKANESITYMDDN